MSIKRRYARSLRAQLDHYPVWDIGAEVTVGDYGLVDDDGCFRKLGAVSEFLVEPQVQPSQAPALWEFATKGTTVVEVAAGGGTNGVETELQLSFARAYSLYLCAADSSVATMSNPNEVGGQLRNSTGWKRSYCFVSSVRTANSLVLLMNTMDKSTINITGSIDLINAVRTGQLASSTGVTVSGDAGLKSLGVKGSFYVDLMRVGLFGVKPRGEEEGDVCRLDPLDDLPKVS